MSSNDKKELNLVKGRFVKAITWIVIAFLTAAFVALICKNI